MNGSAFTLATNAGPASAPLRYAVLGSAIDLTVPDAVARRMVARVLARFAATPDGLPNARFSLMRDDDGGWHLSDGETRLRTDSDFTSALLALEWHVVTAAIDRRHDLFHLHGAALAAPDGAGAVLLVGASGAGKTTLALGLMARGFLPYGDDVILIEPASGALHAVPRAFHLREPTRTLIHALNPPDAWELEAEPAGFFLPPRWAEGSPAVRTVFFPEYRPDEPPALLPLSPPEAAQTLLGQTVTLDHAPALALAVVARLTARAVCYRLTCGDLAATVALVRDAVVARVSADAHGG